MLLVTRQGLNILCSFPITVNHCGGTLNALSGEITSPNYPGTYRSNRDCRWKIVAPAGNHLELTFKVKCSKLLRRFIKFVSLAYLLSRSQFRERKKAEYQRHENLCYPRESGSGIRKIFVCEIWNPGLWNPESGIEVYESEIPLNIRNPESKFHWDFWGDHLIFRRTKGGDQS